MALRFRPKYARLDPENPQAWAQCDRCGFVWRLVDLQWQTAYRGTSSPVNTRILVCPRHLDPLNPQETPLILPPDPPPVMNSRIGAQEDLGETSFLLAEEGDVLTTEDSQNLIVSIPSPFDNASTSYLETAFIVPSGDVSTMYLDIFDGDPTAGGVSVLASITGSAVRTDIAASLTTVSGIAVNPATITVAASSGATVNTNYVAFYSASISGALLMSGALNVRGQTVKAGNPVVFAPLGISININ